MSRHALSVCLTLVALTLAGCVGGTGDPGTGAEAPTDESAPTGGLETPGSNASSVDRTHVHDRWQGETVRSLFDGTVSTQSSTDLDPTQSVVDNFICVFVCGALAEFAPAEGEIVPPGTERVTVTADWSEQNAEPAARTNVYLSYMAANMTDWQWIGPRDPTATWTIDTTVPMADGGHAQTSLWRFRLIALRQAGSESTEEIDITRVSTDEMTFDVTVQAHRTNGSLPLEPGHPDWWADGSRRLVLSGGDSTTSAGAGEWYASTGPCICRGYEFWDGSQHDPVPPGTSHLVAHVNWTNDAPTQGTAADAVPWLMYYNGDGFRLASWEPAATEDGAWTYTLPVPADKTDGMYTEERSRWLILVGFQGGTDAGIDEPLFGTQTSSPYVFQGDWSLTVHAYNATELPAGLPGSG